MAEPIDPHNRELSLEELEELERQNIVVGLEEDGSMPTAKPEAASEGPTSPEKADEKDGEEEVSLEEILDNPGVKAVTNLIPGNNPLQQYVPQLSKAILGAIPSTKKVLDKGGESFVDATGQNPLLPLATGSADFAIDGVNHFSPLDLPEIPKYKNEISQAFREIASVVIPTIYLTRAGVGKLQGAAAARPLNIGKWAVTKDPLVTWLGEAAFSGGVGASVDYLNKTTGEGHNLLGYLKSTFPDRLGWINDNWATLDEDSEDIKRDKGVKEGAAIGIFSDLGVGIARLANALKGVDFSTYIKPRNSSAEAYFKELNGVLEEQRGAIYEKLGKSQTGDELLDALDEVEVEVERSALSREDALQEVAQWQLSKKAGAELDEPILGVHSNLIDPVQQGTVAPNKRGVADAMVAAARIQNNRGTTWGRLGSIITEAALKYGLEADDLSRRTLVDLVKESITNSGKWDHIAKGATTSFEEIDAAGTRLAEVLYDPMADRGFLVGILDEFKNINEGIENLNNPAYNGVMKAMKSYMDDYMNMDTMKAQAYLTTSMAGQISDIAEGARMMDDTNIIARAQEQILDRLEYLMVEKGLASYIRGSSLNYLNTWKRMWAVVKNRDPKKLKDIADKAREQTEDALGNIIPRNRNFVNELREIGYKNPEFLKPLWLAYELTDGNVDSIYKLNNWVGNNLGVVKKAFVDLGDPSIPSQVMQGVWGSIYNSMLSSVVTPMKAGLSNAILLLEKPAALFAGAAIRQDMDSIRRGWYQYSAVLDTLRKGAGHMGMVFKKSTMDPHSVPYVMRDDLEIKNANTLEVLNAVADAAEANGELGPRVMVNFVESLNDLQKHPVLRLGVNAMGAFDGFARAVLANVEARGRAYTEMLQYGDMGPDDLKAAAEKHYNEMFDRQGFLKDEAVEHTSRELAMSLDNEAISGISSIITHVPAIRPFLMFTKTSMNMIGAGWNRTALGALAGDYAEVVGYHGKKTTDFSRDEIRSILEKRGISYDYQAMDKFDELRNEITGRIAIGSVITTMAVGMALQGKLRGDGHYDREVQKLRREVGWNTRQFQDPLGNWHSFENLGPWADWVAAVANVADNFDMVSETHTENAFRKLSYIAAATITGRTPLQGLEPLLSIVSGDEGAWNRWGASFSSSLAPLSGLRNDIGRVLSPMLTIHNNEYMALLRNRNRGLDVLDPQGAAPVLTDWLDGSPVWSHDNLLVRLFNDLSPFKVSGALTPERQFLVDIEFDSRPIMLKGDDGVEFTPQEQAELYAIMGKDQYFLKKLREVMKRPDSKNFVKKMRALRRKGYDSDQYPIDKFAYLFIELNQHLRDARDLAISNPKFTGSMAVMERQAALLQQKQAVLEGRLPEDVQEILDQ